MQKKLKVGILGGTGYVGQRFITLLQDHPWFDVKIIAASSRSAGKMYIESVEGRWKLPLAIPDNVKNIVVKNASDIKAISDEVDFVFCAVDMKKEEIAVLEETYAKTETPVVSNNSAHRWTSDIPVIIPEINPGHLDIIGAQKKRLGTSNGFIVAKPNCSIQSYVPALHALLKYKPTKVSVCTYQAISGSGKIFSDWPEIVDNLIPYIGGEEEKSEQEPLKLWGKIVNNQIIKAEFPLISAQCYRVPISDGHTAAVSVAFDIKPSKQDIVNAWKSFETEPQRLKLPSSPEPFLQYMDEQDRPQAKLDRDFQNGMGISIGRLQEDKILDYKFACLSHNTIRGAAGGGVLTAEMLVSKGYINAK